MHTACAVSVCLTLLALIVRVSALALLQIVILRSEERQRQQGGWFGKRVDSPDDIRERLTRARTELKSGQDGAS